MSNPEISKRNTVNPNLSSTQTNPQATRPNPDVHQGDEITRIMEKDELVNGGVGPQPDEHRGNSQGGFTYDQSYLEENSELRKKESRNSGDDREERESNREDRAESERQYVAGNPPPRNRKPSSNSLRTSVIHRTF